MPEHYLGIDVGWDQTKTTTGLCLITVDQDKFTWQCCKTGTRRDRRLETLRALIPEGATLSGVGIDGPLFPRLIEDTCYRAAEALLSRGLVGTRCKPGQTNSPRGQSLHCHATRLANLVLELRDDGYLKLAEARHCDPAVHQSRIVEAYPDAFLAFLLSDGDFDGRQGENEDDKRSDIYWGIAVASRYLHDLIERLAPSRCLENRLSDITHHDHRAAFICSLSAMCVARNEYTVVGAPNCGDIVLPPHGLWRADASGQIGWVQNALCANVVSVRRGNQRGNPCPNFNQARVISNGQQWKPQPE